MAGRALGFFSQVYGLQPSGMTATLLGQPLDTIKTLMQSLGWTFSVFGDDSREGVIDDLFSTKFLGSDGKVEQLVVWCMWCMFLKFWYASKTRTRQCSNHSKLHEAVPGTLNFMNPTSISVCHFEYTNIPKLHERCHNMPQTLAWFWGGSTLPIHLLRKHQGPRRPDLGSAGNDACDRWEYPMGLQGGPLRSLWMEL